MPRALLTVCARQANDEDPEVGAWRMIYPRAYLNANAVDSMGFFKKFAEAHGID